MSSSSEAPTQREGVHACGWSSGRIALLFMALSLLVYLAGGDLEGFDAAVVWTVSALLAVASGRAAHETGRLARARVDTHRAGPSHSEGGNA